MTDLALQLPLVFVSAPVELRLSNGMVTVIDAANEPWLSRYDWRALRVGNTWYAVRDIYRHGQPAQIIYMHREILQAYQGPIPDSYRIDHVNHDGLCNVISNLRLVTAAENLMNARKRQGCSSRYKGVDWSKRAGKWRARIKRNGQEIHLGLFESEIEAAQMYNRVAAMIFGEFAHLNDLSGKNDWAKEEAI